MKDEIPDEKLEMIIKGLCCLESEKEHIEFKENQADPIAIAKTISGIANTMTRLNIPRGYFVWGVEDDSHKIVGTKFNPDTKKIGNEDLKLWLSKHIQPVFRELQIDGKRVIVLIICSNPTDVSKFDGEAYIRIGANTRKLREFSDIEKEVWRRVLECDYEMITARACLSKEEVMTLLDYDAFYSMRRNKVPVEKDAMFDETVRCGMVKDNHDTTFDITNLGALLYAKDIRDFPGLENKMVRVIHYRGEAKLTTINEIRGNSGYVVEFNKIKQYVMERTIDGEEIGKNGIRELRYLYPELTIRELFANIIAHQDLTINTMQPMIEIYSNRVEFVNPGAPLIPTERFVDYPPQTRNMKMAEELYKVGICERRGSGWDKIAAETSEHGYSAPTPEVTKNTTRVILTQRKTLADMTNEERMWSIYIYACLLWVKKQYLTNTHVRKLFNILDSNMSTASALLAQAVKTGLIVIFDEKSGTRSRKYLPKYARED
ncbi:MAG: putative DNA binding domain-containing protein [Candidatus Saccharibacteria bacterium]|nr:putative DNA binding domain-containing protein [Candidatus Saccharibacteria bacterium]